MNGDYRRIQLCFTRGGEAASLSNLDLVRALQKAILESGLPVRISEGAERKVKMGFASSLPQGMESRAECLEIQVRRHLTVRGILDALRPHRPAGIDFYDGDSLYPGEKWTVSRVVYEVGGDPADLPDADEIGELLARDRIPVTRRDREVDLRPLLARLERRGDVLRMEIAWTERGTARPGDVMRALSRDPDAYPAVKVGVVFATSFGEKIRKPNDP